jgi:hypothetical protein
VRRISLSEHKRIKCAATQAAALNRPTKTESVGRTSLSAQDSMRGSPVEFANCTRCPAGYAWRLLRERHFCASIIRDDRTPALGGDLPFVEINTVGGANRPGISTLASQTRQARKQGT